MPGIPKVVAVGVRHRDKRLYGVDVFLLHFRDAGAGRQQGEARKSLNVGVSLQLLMEAQTRDTDCTLSTTALTLTGLLGV